ncbi:hypothetical protein Tco_1318308 [Tanacetum coccineum]
MSISSAHQQSLADAGSETRPSMLKRGSYIAWASRFRIYLNKKRETRKFLNHSIDVGPYEFKKIQPNENEDPRLETKDDLTGCGNRRGGGLRESSFQNIRPRRFLRSGSHSNIGCKKSHQSSKYRSDLGQITRSPVLWAEIGESSLTGPELVLDMTDNVVLIKEKLKAARDRQKSYADNRRKPLEFEVEDRVMLKVSPWKGVIRFEKNGKLAPSLHVPLDEIKVDKTLRFVEEPVENSDREVNRLKCSRMLVVKVHLGSKRGL